MNLKLNKTRILLYFIIIPYLKPYNISLVPSIDNIFKLWKVVATAVVLLLFFLKKQRIHKQSIYGIAFIGIWSTSIYLNCETLGNQFQEILSIVGIILIAELVIGSKDSLNELFKVLYRISAIYITLQLITVIAKRPLFGTPKNNFDIYFLGGDNRSAFILLPLSGFMFANDFRFYSKIRLKTFLFAFMGWFGLLYTFAVTGMIAYGIYLILMIFINYPFIQKLITPKKIIIMTTVILIGVIFFNIQNNFTTIFTYFGKTGLSSREIIWNLAFNIYRKNWIIGIGALSQEQINLYLLNGADHAHNIILEILMDTGVVGSIVFGLWMKKIFTGKRKNISKQSKSLINCFIAFLFCSILDFYIGLIYFYLLIIMIYISRVEDIKLEEIRKMKKICILCVSDKPIPAVNGGAVETLIQNLIEENEIKHRYFFTVLTIFSDNIDYSKYKYTKFVTIPYVVLKLNKVYWKIVGFFKKIFQYQLIAPVQRYWEYVFLRRNYKEFDYIIEETDLQVIKKLRNKLNNNIIYHLHYVGNPTKENDKLFDYLFPVSYFIAEEWKKKTNRDESTILELKNCIDIKKFTKKNNKEEKKELLKKLNIRQRDIVALYVGRIIPEKGVIEMLKAVEKIKNDKLKLIIIGSSNFASSEKTEYEKKVEKIIKKLS